MKSLTKKETNKLIKEILAYLEKAGITEKDWTDSDMFIYCDWYTGDFWERYRELNKKVA